MSYNLTTSGAILWKAGYGVSSDVSGSMLATFCDYAEQTFNSRTKRNWIGNPAAAAFSGAISQAVSAIAASHAIAYDISGYLSPFEAQLKLDVLKDEYETIIKSLIDKDVQDFID